MASNSSCSRRKFLKSSSILALPGIALAKNGVNYPPYPEVSGGLDHQWSFSKNDRKEMEDAKWSLSYYKHSGLRERVRNETEGIVDIDLSGIVAMRIADTKDTLSFGSEPNNRFDHIRTAWLLKHDAIKAEVEHYLTNFSKNGFDVGEGINLTWMLHLLDLGGLSSPVAGVWLDATDSDPASIDIVASGDGVSLTRYPLEYPMSPDTVNMNKDRVKLAQTKNLPFIGWFGSWGYQGHLFAVSGIHPVQDGLADEIERPFLDTFFSELTGKEVTLNINYQLDTQMHNLMERVN